MAVHYTENSLSLDTACGLPISEGMKVTRGVIEHVTCADCRNTIYPMDPESGKPDPTAVKCPKAPDGGTHHWIPVLAGQYRGEPLFTQECRYCELKYGNLLRSMGLLS